MSRTNVDINDEACAAWTAFKYAHPKAASSSGNSRKNSGKDSPRRQYFPGPLPVDDRFLFTLEISSARYDRGCHIHRRGITERERVEFPGISGTRWVSRDSSIACFSSSSVARMAVSVTPA